MRIVSRLKMIRWHYFDNQIIDFKGKSTILTGDNASGKSTVIDAMQVILIGHLKEIKFNSSAHEQKTERTLLSYLRGKIGSGSYAEEGDYLRNEDFTSYLAIEIEVTNKKSNSPQYYILGVVFDYHYKSNIESHSFFKIDGQQLDDSLFFIEPNLPRTREQFMFYLKNQGYDFEKYQTIEKYRNDIRHLLGGVKDTFFTLLSKGISFSPITNLRKFAYDYILDAHEIDISLMQDYVEQTNELVDSIKIAEEQIDQLKKIKNKFDEIEHIINEILITNYMQNKAELEILAEEISKLKQQLLDEEQLLIDNNKVKDDLLVEREKLDNRNTLLSNELNKHDIKLKQTFLNEQIENLIAKVEEFKRNNKNIKHKLKNELIELEEMIKILKYVEIDKQVVMELSRQKSLFENVVNSSEYITWSSEMSEFNKHWEIGYRFILQKQIEWNSEIENLQTKKKEIELTISELNRNQILSSSSSQMVLKKLLKDEFNSMGHDISVDLLCEVIDVRRPEWRNAIEGYLHTQKFNILVPPSYFNQALNIYEKNKYKYNLESVGLVDTDKVLKNINGRKINSLAEEIVVDIAKDYVIAYIDYLLGSLIKCENVNELRNYSRAITRTCMVYQGYTARQIPKNRIEQFYIGKNAIQAMLAKKQIELIEVEASMNSVTNKLKLIQNVLGYTSSKHDRLIQWKNSWVEEAELISLEGECERLNKELFSLDTSEIEELEKQIKNNKVRLNEIATMSESINKKIWDNETAIAGMKSMIKTNLNELEDKEKVFNEFCLKQNESILAIACERWVKEEKNPLLILTKCKNSINKLEKNKLEERTNLIEVRVNYNKDFRFFADVKNESNYEYNEMLRILEESEITKYKEKAEEARLKAQQSFREDFIARLKDQIEKAKSDFKELNNILRGLKFGTDRYHFRVSPNENYIDYYKMLTDSNLESGYSIFSGTFDDEYGHIVEDLFEKISGENSEKNLDLLDYRTYLSFELEVTDNSGKITRYSKVALEKSGGETQVPFYVSILASFYHTYHMGRKDDSFRLVIFDEAFNRMDANRVDEAIQFIKDCGFQTIIVAPTGKVALLAPHFENSVIVMKENYHSFAVPVAINELLEFEVEEDYHEPFQDAEVTIK